MWPLPRWVVGAHVLRTTNSGGFWDDLSANLPDVPAHGITADRTSGVVYVATDGGVFLTRADLENPGPPSAWTRIGGGIPDVAAVDVKLDASGNQLYVALDGYGIYAARAPHRSALRLVNAADFSQHPAAPGSLLSVVGGKINSARAGSLNFPVLAASDTESQIQVPFEIVGPAVSLDVQGEHGRFTFGLPVQTLRRRSLSGAMASPCCWMPIPAYCWRPAIRPDRIRGSRFWRPGSAKWSRSGRQACRPRSRTCPK